MKLLFVTAMPSWNQNILAECYHCSTLKDTIAFQGAVNSIILSVDLENKHFKLESVFYQVHFLSPTIATKCTFSAFLSLSVSSTFQYFSIYNQGHNMCIITQKAQYYILLQVLKNKDLGSHKNT